jgi:hypothetical protein
LILEDDTPETNSLRVTVVWDRWSACPTEFRSPIILDSYAAAHGEDTRRKITLAIGVTVEEAVDLGLLPFKVLSARRRDESPSPEAYRKAMTEAGGVIISGDEGLQLRFATLDDAAAAMEALEHRLPGSKWMVVEEVFPGDGTRSAGWSLGRSSSAGWSLGQADG